MSQSTKRVQWNASVTFKLAADVKFDSENDESDLCFLSTQDNERIRMDNKLTLDLIEADLFVETRVRCRRGLESKTLEGRARCEDRRRKVRRAVFDEQRRQRKSQLCDPKALAKAAMRESHESRSDAYLAGISDSNVARILDATEKQSIPYKKTSAAALTIDEPVYLMLLEQRESFRCQVEERFPCVA